jgi:monoamine oxidase
MDTILAHHRGSIQDGLAGRLPISDHLAGITATDQINRFDLGPTWFWPGIQCQLNQLVSELGLERFEQHESGDMMVERSPDEMPMRVRGYVNSPASMRLVGGMGALITVLQRRLESTRIITGHKVRRLCSTDKYVELDSEDSSGHTTTWRCERILLALPPRLIENTIEFSPALPQDLARAGPVW